MIRMLSLPTVQNVTSQLKTLQLEEKHFIEKHSMNKCGVVQLLISKK